MAKKRSWPIDEVPVKQRAWAKQKGVVAVIGSVGLTQERLDLLLAAAKEPTKTVKQQEESYPDVCPRCHQTSCNGYDCR